MRTFSLRMQLGLNVLLGMLLLSGCGGGSKPTGQLSGKVTYKGAAVTDAQIQIQSPDSGFASGATLGADGTYKFTESIPTGKYKASIIPVQNIPVAGSTKELSKPTERTDIPQKYRTGGTSPIEKILTTDSNTLDVEMTD